jgi:hypothetical protein
VNKPPFNTPSNAYKSVIVDQFVTNMSSAERMILTETMKSSVLCLSKVSEIDPPNRDPATLYIVKTVVINPICVMVKFS